MDTKKAALDLSRLLGFDAVEGAGSVDFRDDAVASRLGAKVGETSQQSAPAKKT